MRFVRPIALVALCVGCDGVYPEAESPWFRVDASYPDGVAVDRPPAALGQACDDASCPVPLVCRPRACGAERTCEWPVTSCGQRQDLVCDCEGTTRYNGCAARAVNVGVSYAGACDGGAADEDAGDAATTAGVNACARTGCGAGGGAVCCAEPTSPTYGRCYPVQCVTCCRHAR